MSETYKETIARLIAAAPFSIDPDIKMEGRPPTMASSEFLTNKEQGDWAERVVFNAINENSIEFIAIQYGRSDSLGAGDPGFADFYQKYQDELNRIREFDFRLCNWSSSENLRNLSEYLKSLKDQIKILHKHDYLSITPKIEDLALVNHWIQNFGVRHYYLQVFFDKAYVITFKDVLEISSDPTKEDVVFSVERVD